MTGEEDLAYLPGRVVHEDVAGYGVGPSRADGGVQGEAVGRESTELYSTIVAAGIVAWFCFQSFENIGMARGIMPVAGIPLPFVFYGGSSMFAVWVAVGLLQSRKVQRPVQA